MITQKYTPWESQTEYYGLSTDSKPAGRNGDKFTEMDSGKTFLYNETGAAWVEQPASGGGGGGGGSSDLSLATVTLTVASDAASSGMYMCPVCDQMDGVEFTSCNGLTFDQTDAPHDNLVPLYKGAAQIFIGELSEGASVSTTGNISLEDIGGAYFGYITGDCTITVSAGA